MHRKVLRPLPFHRFSPQILPVSLIAQAGLLLLLQSEARPPRWDASVTTQRAFTRACMRIQSWALRATIPVAGARPTKRVHPPRL